MLSKAGQCLAQMARMRNHSAGLPVLGRSSTARQGGIFGLRLSSTASVSTTPSSIAFIGLGNMGYSMAKNLMENVGVQRLYPGGVKLFDVDRARAEQLKASASSSAVVSVADSVADAAAGSAVIVTMLPATQHVQFVLLGGDEWEGVLSSAQENALIIDCSTIDPLASQQLSANAAAASLQMIDAPVSGGVTGAAAGTLTFMVGGSAAAVEAAKPVLSAMGKNIVHCGGAGTGGITKLCNNLALGISMIGTSEAMALGTRLGMDPKTLASVMNTSTARCWSSDTYNPVPGVMENVPSSKGYAGGFGVALMEKDLGLAMDLAQKVKARTPLGAGAQQLYGVLTDHGYASKDFSVVYEFLSTGAKK